MRAIAPALAGPPDERQATKGLGLSLMRKMQEIFAALRVTKWRAFQHPGGGCAMLRAKICLGILVAALACVSTSFAQYCSPYSLSVYIQTSGTTLAPQSAFCPPNADLYLWGSTQAPNGIDLHYLSGPGDVIVWYAPYLPCGLTLTVGEQAFPCFGTGGGTPLRFTVPGEYAFQVQALDSNGAPMGSPGSFTVTATTGADATNFGVCKQCQSQAADPINLTNGNVWVQQRDYSSPGLGGGLELVRTWNSLWQWSSATLPAEAGMFGNSWRSTYEEVLSGPDSNNNLMYYRGDGSAWTFTYNNVLNSYSLTSPPDERAQLASNPTGGFTLTLADHTQKVFNGQNLLAAIIDRNNNQTTIAYDTSNRITSVTSAGGSTLSFTYGDPNNTNQVTTVQDSVGTVATYTYDNSSRLTLVTYADTSTLNFSYDPASSLILSVTDKQGRLLVSHTYDAQRRGLTSARAYGVDSVSLTY